MKISILIILVIISLFSCNACSCKSSNVSYDVGVKKCDTIFDYGSMTAKGESVRGYLSQEQFHALIWKEEKFTSIVTGLPTNDSLQSVPGIIFDSVKCDTIDTAIGLLSSKDWWGSGNKQLVHEYDTIKCIMLVCDTTQIFVAGVQNSNWSYGIPIQDPKTIWQYGYEVRKTNPKYHTWEGNEYLDEQKNSLSPNVVVWQSINIKRGE